MPIWPTGNSIPPALSRLTSLSLHKPRRSAPIDHNQLVFAVGLAVGRANDNNPFAADFSSDYGKITGVGEAFTWFPRDNSAMPHFIQVKREMISY